MERRYKEVAIDLGQRGEGFCELVLDIRKTGPKENSSTLKNAL